jgi:hypothetical protein
MHRGVPPPGYVYPSYYPCPGSSYYQSPHTLDRPVYPAAIPLARMISPMDRHLVERCPEIYGCPPWLMHPQAPRLIQPMTMFIPADAPPPAADDTPPRVSADVPPESDSIPHDETETPDPDADRPD